MYVSYIITVILLFGILLSPGKSYACVINLKERCDGPGNSVTCVDKAYCQTAKNWCFAYTQQTGKKFNSEAEIRQHYSRFPAQWQKGTNLNKFINDWNRCRTGVWRKAYDKTDKKPTPEKAKSTGSTSVRGSNTGTGTGSSDKISMCSGSNQGSGIGTVTDPFAAPFCLNSLMERKSLRPEGAGPGLLGITEDPQTLLDESVDPTNSQVSKSDRKYEDQVRRVRDNSFNASTEVDQPQRLKAMKELAYQRFKDLSGFDMGFLEKCTGEKINPEELFQMRFEDQDDPINSKSFGSTFNRKVQDQCLKIEMTPKAAHLASIMRLATRGNEFRVKIDESKPLSEENSRVLKCANISDAGYCGTTRWDGKVKEMLMPGCVTNINTVSAGVAGATFGFGDPRDKTFIADSHRQQICNQVKQTVSQDNSQQSRQAAYKKAEEMYLQQCESLDYIYSWAETGFRFSSNIAIIAGSMVIAGPAGPIIMIGTSAATTAAQTYNDCYRRIPEDLIYSGKSDAQTVAAINSAKNACYTQAAQDGALDGVINSLTAGFGAVIRKGATNIAGNALKDLGEEAAEKASREIVEKTFKNGLDISSEILKNPRVANLLTQAGVNAAELPFDIAAEYTRCHLQNEYIGMQAECTAEQILTNVVQGRIIGSSVNKVVTTSAFRKADNTAKKVMLEQEQSLAKKSSEFQKVVKDVKAVKLNDEFWGYKFTPEDKVRMRENERIIKSAENGQIVKMDDKTYKVTLSPDGSKKFSSMSNGIVDGKEWFNTYPNAADAKKFKETQSESVIPAKEVKTMDRTEASQPVDPEAFKKFQEQNIPRKTNIYNFDDLPESVRNKTNTIEETPDVLRMRAELAKPNPTAPEGANIMMINPDGSMTRVTSSNSAAKSRVRTTDAADLSGTSRSTERVLTVREVKDIGIEVQPKRQPTLISTQVKNVTSDPKMAQFLQRILDNPKHKLKSDPDFQRIIKGCK